MHFAFFSLVLSNIADCFAIAGIIAERRFRTSTKGSFLDEPIPLR